MKNYNIVGSGITQKKAEIALEAELKKENEKLKKSGLSVLKPSDNLYSVVVKLANGVPAKRAIPLEATYQSRAGFDSVIEAVKKAYGKTSYKIDVFTIIQSYSVNQKQLNELKGAKKRTPTSSPLYSRKESEISSLFKL